MLFHIAVGLEGKIDAEHEFLCIRVVTLVKTTAGGTAGGGSFRIESGILGEDEPVIHGDIGITLRIGTSPFLHSNHLTEKEYALLPQTDFIMNHTFWVGTFPALREEDLQKIATLIHAFVKYHIC